MATYALKDSAGKIVNVIALEPKDLGTRWNPPEGFTVVLDPKAQMPKIPAPPAKRIKIKDTSTGLIQVFEVMEGL